MLLSETYSFDKNYKCIPAADLLVYTKFFMSRSIQPVYFLKFVLFLKEICIEKLQKFVFLNYKKTWKTQKQYLDLWSEFSCHELGFG